ncbi:MAG: helix-turn-helix transcriptional regulator [Cyanobacteria bacterium J06643_5]|jgi:DNA-binding Xre family transcriptional regulator
MPVVNKIKQFIEGRKLSIYRFAKDTNVSETTAYTLFHTPTQRPSPSVLDKICDQYRIQPSEILEWVPPEEVKEEEK